MTQSFIVPTTGNLACKDSPTTVVMNREINPFFSKQTTFKKALIVDNIDHTYNNRPDE